MGVYLDPKLKKNEKCFFDLEACQLPVVFKTLLACLLILAAQNIAWHQCVLMNKLTF